MSEQSEKDLLVLVAAIDTRLQAMDKRLQATDKRLFGNGQGGIVKEQDRRITSLERWHWAVGGGAVVVVAILGIVASLVGG